MDYICYYCKFILLKIILNIINMVLIIKQIIYPIAEFLYRSKNFLRRELFKLPQLGEFRMRPGSRKRVCAGRPRIGNIACDISYIPRDFRLNFPFGQERRYVFCLYRAIYSAASNAVKNPSQSIII